MDHTDIVAKAKADLQWAGRDLTGPCGAFAITALVAWRLRAEGAGYLTKTSGNNCEGFATDIICYPDGHIFDILIGSGDENGPSWQDRGAVDPARYTAAKEVTDPDTPKPQDPVEELRARLASIEQKLDILIEGLRGYFGGGR